MFLWMNHRRSFESDHNSGLHLLRQSINDSVKHHFMRCMAVRSTFTAKKKRMKKKHFNLIFCLIYISCKRHVSIWNYSIIIPPSTSCFSLRHSRSAPLFLALVFSLRKIINGFITLNILDHLVLFSRLQQLCE